MFRQTLQTYPTAWPACAVSILAAVCATLYYKRQRLWYPQAHMGQSISQLQHLLAEFREVLHVSADALCSLRNEMYSQMKAALSSEGHSSMLMLPHVVDQLPNGLEAGDFFAVDMGGTNFRIIHARLSGNDGQVAELEIEKFEVEERLRSVPATELFDFMAAKLAGLAKRLGKEPQPGCTAIVGFCFSFPMHQTSPHNGTMITWGKGFTNPGAVGQDPAVLLEEALTRQGMQARVMSLVNDAVATLAACRYTDPDTMLGVILGTGVNGAYVEQPQNVQNAGRHLAQDTHVIIDCEWGDFVSPLLPMTDADKDLDAASGNPGCQHYEKMTAGLYLGEIARRLLLKLAEEASLFGHEVPLRLQLHGSLHTSQLSSIDHDNSPDMQQTAEILQTSLAVPVEQIPTATRLVVKEVCGLVGKRAGRLKAVAVAAVMHQLGRDTGQRTVIGVDGGVYEQYDNYREALQEGLVDIMGKEAAASVHLRHVANASSLGAAYLAAAAVRQNTVSDLPD